MYILVVLYVLSMMRGCWCYCCLITVFGFLDNRLTLQESFISYGAEIGYLKRPSNVVDLLRGNVVVNSAGSLAGKRSCVV